jgi:hypothetical protein
MDFTIVQIGDVTENGNNIVKMQRKLETTTVLGTMRKSETYYAAVKTEEVDVKVDDVINLDPSDFTVIERPFTTPDGEEIMLKWLSLK